MGDATRLPDAEMDVMSRLWAAGPMTARQLREALAESRPLSHSSICTLLTRLEEKGYVQRQKGDTGKAFVYRPAKGRQSASSEVLGRLVDRLFEGKPMSLVVSLLPFPSQKKIRSAVVSLTTRESRFLVSMCQSRNSWPTASTVLA